MTKANIISFLIFQVLPVIDENRLRISVEEMSSIIRHEKLFEYFNAHPGDFDVSVIKPEDQKYINRNLKAIELTYGARKLGAVYNGFCTLLSYLAVLLDRSIGSSEGWDVKRFEAERKIKIVPLSEEDSEK